MRFPRGNGSHASLRLTFHPQGDAEQALAGYVEMLAFQGSLLVLAVVCSRLHNLLLPERPSMSN
jgi:hypothetical protein